MTWRITCFVSDVERTADGWLLRGEVGLGPPHVGDRFFFVQPGQAEPEFAANLRVVEVEGAVLRVRGTAERVLGPGDMLGGEVER